MPDAQCAAADPRRSNAIRFRPVPPRTVGVEHENSIGSCRSRCTIESLPATVCCCRWDATAPARSCPNEIQCPRCHLRLPRDICFPRRMANARARRPSDVGHVADVVARWPPLVWAADTAPYAGRQTAPGPSDPVRRAAIRAAPTRWAGSANARVHLCRYHCLFGINKLRFLCALPAGCSLSLSLSLSPTYYVRATFCRLFAVAYPVCPHRLLPCCYCFHYPFGYSRCAPSSLSALSEKEF